MNLEETITLIECLRESGATHFKSRDLEVSFGESAEVDRPRPKPHAPLHAPPAGEPSAEAKEAPASPENTKKAEDLINKLKMSPEQLIDAIFPDGAGG